jgi:membrane associated rhomboid family serine protease
MDMINSNLIIIALTCVISYTAFNNQKLMADWILLPYLTLKDKQYYRFVTHGFLHADFMHLLFNMMTLYFFGSMIESFYNAKMGMFGYAAFYLGGIIVSVLPGAMQNSKDPKYATLGASGAVSAVLFAFILFKPWTMLLIFIVPCPAIIYAVLYVAYSIWQDKKAEDNVNHSAHLWGAAYGVAATVLVDPSLISNFINQLMAPFR